MGLWHGSPWKREREAGGAMSTRAPGSRGGIGPPDRSQWKRKVDVYAIGRDG
ncbi:hypothetical protein Csa_014621 [Cucumis sativus]|nr:hypothetical protein Csa_014621 [Cucumis sativus]